MANQSIIKNTIETLQSLHLTIDGVKTCPSKYLGSINSVQLPLVVVWPDNGETEGLTSRNRHVMTSRLYSVRCFMEPLGQGNFDEAPRDGHELIDRFIDTYFDNNVLDDGYVIIESVRDSGIITGSAAVIGTSALNYAGNFYKGFTCTLRIKEMRKLL